MVGSRVSLTALLEGSISYYEGGQDARMCIPRVLRVGVLGGFGEELALKEGVSSASIGQASRGLARAHTHTPLRRQSGPGW
jgi:hypothetical protein